MKSFNRKIARMKKIKIYQKGILSLKYDVYLRDSNDNKLKFTGTHDYAKAKELVTNYRKNWNININSEVANG